ncbi:glycolate oxidase subunit GlcE [Methyloglobulus morosus KoM1]|uniref:Glycolate oxidase subunit GlcE n=1 Tax=Methyloglobulus morosus KoM1 TaxID=1116472 RepID=V5E0V3_9GAMM|nr:glycolate oxidase subunit GlcE [Methyloglobulus morosus]ESS73181.1 glycolate oxidase subunit GlcE [Methyloglobulus morosus KoM1]
MQDQDLTLELQAQVQQAIESHTPLQIIGGNSKAFYGAPTSATTPLKLSGHQGIVEYEPSELVVTVRSGTPLNELNKVLAEQGQMLAFEPPVFSDTATIGGTIACGFSGPRRPYAGGARDFVLGCTILNGKAEHCRFGGQVMKNVAGFDVSRLMVGALGQLGVLLDLSLRVMPIPEAEITLYHSLASYGQALELVQRWQGQPWPLSALAYHDNHLRMRLSGSDDAIRSVAKKLGGEIDKDGDRFWHGLNVQQLDFFKGIENLWRISIAPATPMLDIPGRWLLDWGGAQRWLKSTATAEQIHKQTQAQGGYAICFRGAEKTDWLRLEPNLLALHKKIRLAFDPYQLLNSHRFSPEL